MEEEQKSMVTKVKEGAWKWMQKETETVVKEQVIQGRGTWQNVYTTQQQNPRPEEEKMQRLINEVKERCHEERKAWVEEIEEVQNSKIVIEVLRKDFTALQQKTTEQNLANQDRVGKCLEAFTRNSDLEEVRQRERREDMERQEALRKEDQEKLERIRQEDRADLVRIREDEKIVREEEKAEREQMRTEIYLERERLDFIRQEDMAQHQQTRKEDRAEVERIRKEDRQIREKEKAEQDAIRDIERKEQQQNREEDIQQAKIQRESLENMVAKLVDNANKTRKDQKKADERFYSLLDRVLPPSENNDVNRPYLKEIVENCI